MVDTGTHFTLLGHWILLFLMQCGGLGLMTFGIIVIHLTRGQLGVKQRAALRETFNHTGQGDVWRVLLWAIGFTAIMELLGTVFLALQWVPEMGWGKGLFYSFFHTLAAFNNAGFALAADSLMTYAGNPLVNIVISLLFISGGIGFVVIADIIEKRRFRQFALHTKLMLVGTLAINVVAMIVILVLEHGNPATLAALPDWSAKLWASWFQAVTPRSAGFNTLDTARAISFHRIFHHRADVHWRWQRLDGWRDKARHLHRGTAGDMGVLARAGTPYRIRPQHSTRYHP